MGYMVLSSPYLPVPEEELTFKDAQEIYGRLVGANGVENPPLLVLWPDKKIKAFNAYGKVIAVSQGLLNFVNNKDELAFVLAHELGHNYVVKLTRFEYIETSADKIGTEMIDKAGYNVCKGTYNLKRLNDKGDKMHPPSDERFEKVRCK